MHPVFYFSPASTPNYILRHQDHFSYILVGYYDTLKQLC